MLALKNCVAMLENVVTIRNNVAAILLKIVVFTDLKSNVWFTLNHVL